MLWKRLNMSQAVAILPAITKPEMVADWREHLALLPQTNKTRLMATPPTSPVT